MRACEPASTAKDLVVSSQLQADLQRLQTWTSREVQRLETQLATTLLENASLREQIASGRSEPPKESSTAEQVSKRWMDDGSCCQSRPFPALQEPATIDDGECSLMSVVMKDVVMGGAQAPQRRLEEVSPPSSSHSIPLHKDEGQKELMQGHPSVRQDGNSPRLRSRRESSFSIGSNCSYPADCLKLLPAWTPEQPVSPVDARGLGMSVRHMHLISFRWSITEETNFCEQGLLQRTCQRLISRPNAQHRVFWDVLSILVLAYDVIFLPMEVFLVLRSDFVEAMAWTTTIFWSLDFLRSFTMGYHDGGIIEMRWKRVAWHYLRTWFALDSIVLVIDWVYVIGSLSTGVQRIGRIGKSTRILRLMRAVRLVRLIKVTMHMNFLYELICSDVAVTVAKIARFTMAVCLVNHFVACGWYAIGDAPEARKSGSTWVEVLESTHPNPSVAYLYGTSLHWSLTQFTAASMEVMPVNAVERYYTVGVIVFALITLSSFLSTITQAMTHLRDTNQENWRQQESLRVFLGQNRISMELTSRIMSFGRRYRSVARSRVHESDIHIFKAMPETLLVYLHVEVFVPVIAKHPFFSTLMQVDMNAVASICHSSASERPLIIAQELFTYGMKASAMYFVMSGMMEYYRAKAETGEEQVSVEAGSMICEMALWLQWEHCGRMSAGTHTELVCLDTESTCAILVQIEPADCVQKYAELFLRDMVAKHDTTQDLSDLWIDLESCTDRAQQAFEDAFPDHAAGSTGFAGWVRSETTFFNAELKHSRSSKLELGGETGKK